VTKNCLSHKKAYFIILHGSLGKTQSGEIGFEKQVSEKANREPDEKTNQQASFFCHKALWLLNCGW
jgi:hypothetical protein